MTLGQVAMNFITTYIALIAEHNVQYEFGGEEETLSPQAPGIVYKTVGIYLQSADNSPTKRNPCICTCFGRMQADRKEEESRESLLGNSSPPPSDSRGEGQGQRKLAEKGNEFKPERKANAEESFQEGLPDTEDRAASGNLSAARTGGAARRRGKGGVPGEGEENNHTESDPLISDAVGESHEASNPGRQAGVAESGIGGAGGGHDEAAEADELDDAGESRFQSMRSRMKKAKDIMNRRTSTTFRLGKPEGRPLRGSTRSQEKGDVEVGRSGEPTASDDKRDEGLSVVGGDTDPPRTSNYLQPNQEDSDTSRCLVVLPSEDRVSTTLRVLPGASASLQ